MALNSVHYEQSLPDFPVSCATVRGALRRLKIDGTVQQLNHAAWFLQVYPRTVRRWSVATPSRSSIPYASWCLLSVANGDLPASTLASVIPGHSVLDQLTDPETPALDADYRRRWTDAARRVVRREAWRPSTELVASLVMPFGPRVAERGVRQVAEALHVDQSTVWRWVDPSRPDSAIPYPSWSLLLIRERLLEADTASGIRLANAAVRPQLQFA